MADMNQLKQAVSDLDEDTVRRIMTAIADSGGSEAAAAMQACQDGMQEVGDRYESGEYFLGDLIFAGEIMTESMDIIRPFLSAGSGGKGKMILCTVHGDIHDIGKNIVKSMLEAAGFDVIDLGIDVLPETILETAIAEEVRIIALSGVLTLALDSMKDVVDAFKKAGRRDKVRIIIGGNPVTAEACKWIGADAWANSPQRGVNQCLEWLREL